MNDNIYETAVYLTEENETFQIELRTIPKFPGNLLSVYYQYYEQFRYGRDSS